MTRSLLVTPIHNEFANIRRLADQLQQSSTAPTTWVVVDDGSTDGSAETLVDFSPSFEFILVRRVNDGGLIGGSAFKAWQFGLDAVDDLGSYDAIAKLDADVDLQSDYLGRALQAVMVPGVGLAGGVLVGLRDREQNLHVPGPFKLYSRDGLKALASLPRDVGFDVMDEVAIRDAGLEVDVILDLPLRVRRQIGASQGRIHGRRRNGQVCKWVGYWSPYFALHAIRYLFRRPVFIGSVAMLWGYLRAGDGPYSERLRRLHALEQRSKVRQAIRNPISWIRTVYASPTD